MDVKLLQPSSSKIHQTTVNQDAEKDQRSLDSLIQEMNTNTKSFKEKLLFAAKNGSDETSMQLFEQLLVVDWIASQEESERSQNVSIGSMDNGAESLLSTSTGLVDEVQLSVPHLHEKTSSRTASAHSSSYRLEDVRDKEYHDCSLMHLLAQRNKVSCMDYLFRYRPNINLNVVDSMSSTPLLYACAHNSEEAVGWLLSQMSVNINAKDAYNKSALLLCLKNKNYSIAELLISHGGLDVHARGTKGLTVLHTMCQDGDLHAVKFLIERCNASVHRRNNDEENILSSALLHPDVSEYISSKYAGNGLSKLLISVNTMGRNIVHTVAADGLFDNLLIIFKNLTIGDLTSNQVVSMLNSADRDGDTPLILAVKNSRMDLVQFLCQCVEVSVDEGDAHMNTPLYYAMNAKDKEMMTLLTSYGATLKANNRGEETEKEQGKVTACCNSLSTVLMIIISSIAFLCIVAIAAISIGFFTSNIAANARQIRVRSFEEVVNHIKLSIHEITTLGITADTQINSRFNISSRLQVLEFSYTVYQANYKRVPLLSATYCGLANGAVSGVIAGGGDQLLIADAYDDPYLSYFIDVPNTSNTSWSEALTFPNSTAPIRQEDIDAYVFLNDAKKANSTVWTDSYVNGIFSGYLYITLLFVRREPITNDFIGFFAVDATTDSINKFLYTKAQDDNSLIVIIERRTGYLMGVSDQEVPLYKQDNFNAIRYDGTTGENKKLSTMLKFARSRYGGSTMPKIGESHVFDKYLFKGSYQAINIGGIRDEYGFDWLVLQTVPMSRFYRQFYVSLGVMIGVTLLLLVVSLLVAAIASRLFMNPLLVLIQQANDIKVLQLEKVEKSLKMNTSRFTEMSALQTSFAAMVKRLKQYRQFIPDHILIVLEAEFGHGPKNQGMTSVKSNENLSSLGDTSSSNQGGSIGVGVIEPQGIVNRALKSALTSGHVTVLTVTLPDLTDILEQHSANDISETTKDVLIQLKESIRESNGQFVAISSSKAVVVWNSFIRQNDHLNRACTTAESIRSRMTKLNADWTNRGLPTMNVVVGVASGVAYYGNIGSDSTKIFTVVGLPAKHSGVFSEANYEWGTEILVSKEMYEAMADQYVMRPMFELGGVEMYEMGEAKSQDAWAEDINPNNQSRDPWVLYREAFEDYRVNNYKEANAKFAQFLKDHPDDKPSEKLMLICSTKLNNK